MKKFCDFCAKAALLCLLAVFMSCSNGGSSSSDYFDVNSENGVLIQAEKSKSADGGVLLKISNLPKVENTVRIIYEDGSDDMIYHNGNASDDYELEYPFVEAGQTYKFYVSTKVNGNEIHSSKAAIVPDSGVGEFRLKAPIKVDYSDNCIKVTRGEFKGQIESKFSPKCVIQLFGDAEWNEYLGEYETDNLDLSKVYGISQKDVFYFILYSINYNNKMIRSYHNCNNNGCVKVDTSGVTYKYAYDENNLEDFTEKNENDWFIQLSDRSEKKLPKGMSPSAISSTKFSISENAMRYKNEKGWLITKSVWFIKAGFSNSSVKSVKAKVKGENGNCFEMGIHWEYEGKDYSVSTSSNKFCTGKETEFEITPYDVSGIKNLKVFFEPLDAGTYEVSDIQIE